MAILLTLLCTPKGKKIKIYTDLQAAIEVIESLIGKIDDISPREIFKIGSNATIIQHIYKLIRINKFRIKLIKVKAHSGNILNDYVDKVANDIHYQQDCEIEIKTPFECLDFYPKWMNIDITWNLRKFFSKLEETKQFARFLNLNRNAKYRKYPVDWKFSLALISNNEEPAKTSFKGLYQKTWRVKMLIEEIAMTSHLAKKEPLLFYDLPCLECGDTLETFAHIFRCTNNITTINQIMQDAKKLLIELIKEKVDEDNLVVSNLNRKLNDIINKNFWSITTIDINQIDIHRSNNVKSDTNRSSIDHTD